MFWSLLIYFMILGVSEVQIYQRRYVDARLRAERSERMASEARLHHLRSQLDPHFLFNTLNGISAYVERDPRLARRMIEHLGDLLRLSLKSQGKDLVTLKDELTFVQQYLALQKMRFGDRLTIHTDIQQGIDDALVPSLLLQPLIENSLRHGIGSLLNGGSIWLSAQASNGYLFLAVADDGVGLDLMESPADDAGIGLRLTRERLAVRYGENMSSLDTRHRDTGGTEVHISLPLQLREDHTHARTNY